MSLLPPPGWVPNMHDLDGVRIIVTQEHHGTRGSYYAGDRGTVLMSWTEILDVRWDRGFEGPIPRACTESLNALDQIVEALDDLDPAGV